ncbi:hypothetical protein, conserved [Leishmania tarentolae]|uniref:Uncharacterized protein n=1 Tax=Leishmania tarentolae TaxID=5689 RepID=A0A640KQK4_LEITA|nr:hypothetical protein, conserved [Leishmania tarentolae]GET93832.1 hypothetical protein, conserved [Leishmania tarentolae]
MKTDKCVHEAVQTFREAQNLLPTLYTHLSALENIMMQKGALVGAARRREHCFAKALPASHFLCMDADTEESTLLEATPAGPSCMHTTSPVMTSPLGVLAAFSAATVHHLVAQHQRDVEELLGVISRITQQSWPQKVNQLKSKIVQLEGASEVSKACAYPLSASGTAAAVSSTPASSSYFATASELSVALYGFTACLLKMGSVLQETMLALRKDARISLMEHAAPGAAALSTCTSADTASHLAALMDREDNTSEGMSLLSMHSPHWGSGNEATSASRLFDRATGVPAPPLQPTRFVEAVGKLKSFLEARWKSCCDSYLSPESHLLLALV